MVFLFRTFRENEPGRFSQKSRPGFVNFGTKFRRIFEPRFGRKMAWRPGFDLSACLFERGPSCYRGNRVRFSGKRYGIQRRRACAAGETVAPPSPLFGARVPLFSSRILGQGVEKAPGVS